MSNKLKLLNKFRVLLVVSTIAFTCVLGASDPSMAQIHEGSIEANGFDMPVIGLKASLTSGLAAGRVGRSKFENSAVMKVFYQGRNNQPYWYRKHSGSGNAEALLAALERSWTHGLNPASYNTARLRNLVVHRNFLKRTELELLLTESFIKYVQDLSGMRVDSKGLRTDEKSWKQRSSAEDVVALLSSGRSVGQIVNDVAPKGKTYRALQAELVRLSEGPDDGFASILPIVIKGLIRPNERHERIPDIRLRLGVVQYPRDRYRYDDRLAAAVIKFQRGNGLDDDGVIGSNTLEIMNRTKLTKMRQLIANMERLRWADGVRPDKFVLVNVPSATLWAVDRGRVEFEMDVIVGKPVRPTESFVTSIDGIRFNPTWTVPSTIKRFDMVPKLRADPAYFTSKGIELYDGYGRNAQTIDPQSIDWDNISRVKLNKLRMVQVPGDHNALGRIRVLMKNKFNIYLHDTNHKELFEKSQYRHLSSGCVRLRDPQKMARFIMRGKKDWSQNSMGDVLESMETTDIRLEQPIPVYIMYYTAWIDEKGQVVYGPDVYKQDRKLLAKLSEIDGFAIPSHNKIRVVSSDRPEFASNQ